MRRTAFQGCRVCLLAAVCYLGGEGASAPLTTDLRASENRSVASIDLRSVDGKLTQAVGRINENLRDLYTFVRKQPKKLDVGKTISQLRDQLAALVERDNALRELGITAAHQRVRRYVLRDRAEGFIHAWTTFSLLAIVASHHGTNTEYRGELLALDRPKGKESCLSLLLALYSHIRSAEGDAPDPLRVRLKDGAGFFNEFAYTYPWKEKEKPDYVGHDRYLPSTRDLVGTPNDKPETPRDLLSLWSLLNLQLDTTWNKRDKPGDRLNLAPLAAWLRQLHDDKNLTAFDVGTDAVFQYGQAFKERLDRIQKFVAFRDACGKDNVLHALVTALRNARLAGKSPAAVETPLRMQDLIDACKPIDGESLPQAEIWLRYVLLLSYQGEGVDAVASTRGDVKGAEDFYKSTGLDKPFMQEQDPAKATESSPALLRWNKWPAKGHFSRTIFDATAAAYRYAVWEASLPDLEKRRYKSLSGSAERHAYAVELERLVEEGRAAERTHLAPYLDATANPTDPYGFRPKLLADGAIASATASRAERERLANDLRALSTQIGGAVRAQELALLAERTDDPTAIAIAMQGMAGYAGVSRWNINALPTKTFADCARDIKSAVQHFKDDLTSRQYQQDYRERFAAQKGQTEVLELELAAARLGMEIAKQGEEIEKKFKEIADLDVKIRKLEGEVSKLLAAAAKDKNKAAELRLTLANQARDLAAAQVEALQQATAQAQAMIDHASDSLRAMQPRLLEAARKIEDSKKKSGFFSILKAVVNIVGVALGPFTGGASLAAAQAVNTAINIYEKVSNLDLSKVENIAAGLAGIANDVGTLADLSINKLDIGGEAAKKGLAEVKNWLKTAEGDIKRLSEKAKPLLDGLKKLEGITQSKLGQIASALASDIPVSIENGILKVDLGKAGIRLQNKELEKIWSDALDKGVMIANDARARAILAKLRRLLPDNEYRTQLRQAVDELIRVCPEALLLDRDVKAAARSLEESKSRLKAFIDSASAEQRRFLGKLFDGWVIIKDDKGAVIAVERSVVKEAAEFKQRVQHYIKQVRNKALDKLANEIEKIRKDIDGKADKAAKEQDPVALRAIANDQILPAVAELGKKLERLRGDLAEARYKLKDAETNVEIAAADDRAMKAMKEASDLQVQVGELEIRKSLLGQNLAALKIRQEELRIEQEGFRLEAAVRRAELSQAALRRIYATCRRLGVIPDQTTSEASPQLSLDSILTPSYDAKDPARVIRARLKLDHMAGDLIGMLQWMRLLNITAKRSGIAKNPNVEDKDRYVSDRFADILWLLHGPDSPETIAEKLGKLADGLVDLFADELDIPEENLLLARAVAINPKTIRWFDGKPAPGLPNEPPSDAVLRELPEELRPRALGYFRFRFTLKPEKRPDAVEFSRVNKASDPSASYYFFFKESSLIRERPLGKPGLAIDDFRYYVVPSGNAVANPGLPLSAPSEGLSLLGKDGKQLYDQIEEQPTLDQIRDKKLKFWRKNHLAPALGDWTIFLLESTPLAEHERQQRIEECRDRLILTLRIPYLQVPGAGR